MGSTCPCLDCVQVGIEVFPTPPVITPPPKPSIPEKLLKIMRKYKYNWRLTELAHPKKSRKTTKYISKPVLPVRYEKVKLPKLSEEISFYADHQSRPLLRTLVINKGLYGKQNGRKFVRKITYLIRKTWNSYYNYYKKMDRDRRLRQQQRDGTKGTKETKSRDLTRFEDLAKPKRIFHPEPQPKPSKIFDDYPRLDELASPKAFVKQPDKRQGVSPAALAYEATENMVKLALPPARFANLPKPLEPGKVERNALHYKITPRTEALAVPKQRKEMAEVDEDFDPWAISKNALKYKATARIQELAKPLERN